MSESTVNNVANNKREREEDDDPYKVDDFNYYVPLKQRNQQKYQKLKNIYMKKPVEDEVEEDNKDQPLVGPKANVS
jgi:ATP-dependent RNA helicase DDX41